MCGSTFLRGIGSFIFLSTLFFHNKQRLTTIGAKRAATVIEKYKRFSVSKPYKDY